MRLNSQAARCAGDRFLILLKNPVILLADSNRKGILYAPHRLRSKDKPRKTGNTMDSITTRPEPTHRPRLSARHCLSEGWRLFRLEPGRHIGFTLITFLVTIPSVLMPESDPLAGPSVGSSALLAVLQLVLLPALTLGYYIVAFRRLDGRQVAFGDFFGGFHHLLPLMLFVLTLTAAILLLVALPLVALFMLGAGSGFGLFSGLLAAVAVIALVVLPTAATLLYIFVPMLIVDRGLPFWPAMEGSRRAVARNLGLVFRLMLLSVAVQLLGILALGIGMLLTVPVTYLMMAVAYREVCGGPAADPS